MPLDNQTFRRTLGSFASGVTVISTLDQESARLVGVTVSAFSSVSMDPPLVLFCIDKRSVSLSSFKRARHFAVNILAAGQAEISNRFASRLEDKWQGVQYRSGLGQVPVILGCAAHLECSVSQIVDGGDHEIFIGQVEDAGFEPDLAPLVYCRGAYSNIPSIPPQPTSL
jgi:flavin reductase (DIM6/NTAB) family NADH-FMN oxidoreductase RutF